MLQEMCNGLMDSFFSRNVQLGGAYIFLFKTYLTAGLIWCY